MFNPESVLENETHKILWDFDIQTDHLILAGRPEASDSQQHKKTKKNYRLVNFTASADHRVKLKESEKRDKYLHLDRELKNCRTRR